MEEDVRLLMFCVVFVFFLAPLEADEQRQANNFYRKKAPHGSHKLYTQTQLRRMQELCPICKIKHPEGHPHLLHYGIEPLEPDAAPVTIYKDSEKSVSNIGTIESAALPTPDWELENIAVALLVEYEPQEGVAEVLTDALRIALVKTKYFNVLSRQDMDAILDEQNFQNSGYCDDTTCLVEMGKILAVQKIV